MINETVIILGSFENCSEHRLARHVEVYLRHTTSFDLYFHQPLQKIFSRVIAYDFVKRMTEIGIKGINEEVIALVRKERPKYVLWLSAAYEFRESTFQAIREEGTTVIGWFFDDEWRFEDYSRWWVPYLDYCVTNYIDVVPKYRQLGAGVTQAYCTGIPIERDWSNIEEKYDVSFVGRIKVVREQYGNELKKRNVPFRPFGDGWGGFLPFEEMIDVFKTSKINLSFSTEKLETTQKQIKARIFEVCLAGGFLLAEYAPGIETFFDIGKEIVCFRDADEMIDKITYYLQHEEERRAIAQAGWKRATSEYTSFHMVFKVFREVEEALITKGKETRCLVAKSEMPVQMRKRFSDYYLPWVVALLMEDFSFWKDDLALSVSYNPFNVRARTLYIISVLPCSVRRGLFTLYKAKAVEKFLRKPCGRLIIMLNPRK